MGGTFFILAGIAGLATWFYMRSKRASAVAGSIGTSGRINIAGKTFDLQKPSVPPVLRTGTPPLTDDVPVPGMPDIIREAASLQDSLDTLGLSSHGPIPPGGTVSAPIKGTTTQIEERIALMASAIAHAEGFGIPGTLPTRTHNPGDLKLGDRGYGTEQGKTIFGTASEGWEALKAQIRIMYLGRSDFYVPDNTFEQIAYTYTGGDNWRAWLSTVTADLGVSPSTTLRGYLTGGTL